MKKKYKIYKQSLKPVEMNILKLNAKIIHVSQLHSKIHPVYKNSEKPNIFLKNFLKV
jgi:hypothetical protein